MTPVKKPNLHVCPFQTHNSDGHIWSFQACRRYLPLKSRKRHNFLHDALIQAVASLAFYNLLNKIRSYGKTLVFLSIQASMQWRSKQAVRLVVRLIALIHDVTFLVRRNRWSNSLHLWTTKPTCIRYIPHRNRQHSSASESWNEVHVSY